MWWLRKVKYLRSQCQHMACLSGSIEHESGRNGPEDDSDGA